MWARLLGKTNGALNNLSFSKTCLKISNWRTYRYLIGVIKEMEYWADPVNWLLARFLEKFRNLSTFNTQIETCKPYNRENDQTYNRSKFGGSWYGKSPPRLLLLRSLQVLTKTIHDYKFISYAINYKKIYIKTLEYNGRWILQLSNKI